MSTKHNSTCLTKAADDEPIFALRANDPTSPEIIVAWCAANIAIQPHEKLISAISVAKDMQAWKKEHTPTT